MVLLIVRMVSKQRGRKPKDEYFKTKKPDNVEIDKAIIICLPISVDDCMQNLNVNRQEEIMSGLPGIPLPYQEKISEFYSILPDKENIIVKLKKDNSPSHTTATAVTGNLSPKTEIYKSRILPDELSRNNDKNLVFETDIACFWCCHTFKSRPVFMPVDLVKDVYKVKGCFCSFECCNSYMMDNPKYQKNQHLLNYMFRDTTEKTTRTPRIGRAPPRETLSLFGGSSSIEEFRGSNAVYKIIHYPMIDISNQIEKRSTVKQPSKREIKTILPVSNSVKTKKLPNNSLSKLIGFAR